MFVGHFALALAAKPRAPQVSLPVLFAAAQFADLLWPVLVAAGLEHVRVAPGITAFTPLDFVSYPISHSLVMLLVWGVLFGWICFAVLGRKRGGTRAWGVVLGLVVSHWFLDFVTHRPDMPVYPGGPMLGLGLWRSIPATLLTELALFAGGVFVYARATRPRDATGRWAFVGITVFLAAGFVVTALGPPPPSVQAVWMGAVAIMSVTIGLAHWVERHRVVA
jgi:hypothetical protein